jgi:tetratricopeptide (TPR) repeat protein
MVHALLLVLALPAAPQDDTAWYQLYDRGVAAIEQGRPEDARPLLEAALAEQPTEGLKVRTSGIYFVDYMPNLYLAIASQMTGDRDAAHSYLAAAERSGVAASSEVGAPLLAAIRILLREPLPEATPSGTENAPSRSFRLFPPHPPKLSDAEYQRLRHQVAMRCGVPEDLPTSRAPWYFHYELALALARQGDPQRSVEALITSTDHKPQPERQARMYGMWFTDYIPFFWIAKEHAQLGNWECVVDALDASRRSGEVTERDQEFAEFRSLVEEARRHLGK